MEVMTNYDLTWTGHNEAKPAIEALAQQFEREGFCDTTIEPLDFAYYFSPDHRELNLQATTDTTNIMQVANPDRQPLKQQLQSAFQGYPVEIRPWRQINYLDGSPTPFLFRVYGYVSPNYFRIDIAKTPLVSRKLPIKRTPKWR